MHNGPIWVDIRLKLSFTFVLLAFVMVQLMNAFDDLSLEFIILLMESRTDFRAVCIRVNRVGAALITLSLTAFPSLSFPCVPPVFERMQFWRPWVGDRCLNEAGSLDVEHLRRCIEELQGMAWRPEPGVHRVHGASSADVIDHSYVGGQWVPRMELWRAARFPVPVDDQPSYW